MENIIRDGFLIELLDKLEEVNGVAETDMEKELMYRLVSSLNTNVDFKE